MKYIFALILIINTCVAFAQGDTIPNTSELNAVWKADTNHYPLKRGIYKTYEEFLANSPSIQRDFSIEFKSTPDKIKRGNYAVALHLAPAKRKPARYGASVTE